MNASEKIAALESLLVRVQKRAQEPRPPRAAHSPVIEATTASPSPSFEHIPETPLAESPSTVDFAPAASAPPAIERKVEPAAVPAPTATPIPSPTTARGVTASYVAKGGMSEELPDFELEEDEEDGEEGDEEIIVEETAVQAAVSEPSAPEEPEEAEELAIPLRPSTQLRAVVPPTPIELPRSTDDLVLENTPLASALPAATEEAIALQARKIPPQSVPAMPAVAASLDELDLDVSPGTVAPVSTPEFKTPAQTQTIDEPEPTLVTQAIDLPAPDEEPKIEAPIPLVQPARAAEPVRAAEPAPVVEPVIEHAPVVEPAVAVPPSVQAAAIVTAPAPAPVVASPAAPVQPVAYEAKALPDADVLAVEHELSREPASFAKLLRRALSLRVK